MANYMKNLLFPKKTGGPMIPLNDLDFIINMANCVKYFLFPKKKGGSYFTHKNLDWMAIFVKNLPFWLLCSYPI